MPSSQLASAESFAAAFEHAKALHKAGKTADAVAHYEQVRAMRPDDPELLYLLGSAYVHLGRPREGAAALERSLTLRAGYGPALDMAGSAWIAAGEPERALGYFRQSAAPASASAASIERLALTLQRCGLDAEALEQFKRCLAIDPGNAKAHTGAGLSLAALGRLQEAEDLLRACLAVHPRHAAAYLALGTVYGLWERFSDAEQQLRAAVEISPANADAQYRLGVSLQKQARGDEAILAYEKARSLNPADENAAVAMTEAMIDLHRLDDAQAVLETLKGAGANALVARGRLAERLGDLRSAIAFHDSAISADPRNEAAFINRGNARRLSGDYEGALRDYDDALAIKPGVAAAIANRGLCLLALGRLGEAWPDYRSRIRAQANAIDLTAGKSWDGGSLAGKRVLVWTEYGLGDEILFASMLPQVLSEAAACTLVCASRLVTLFRRSFPNAVVIALGHPVSGDYDVRVALTDLAQRFRPDLDSFPRHQGYLSVDADRVADIRRRYRADRKLVGISWRSISGPTGTFKSAPLEQWRDILSVPSVEFISLQYGDVSADVAAARARTGAEIRIDPAVDSSGDLNPFAAQVAAMDLVISVSNTTVHVAAALGKPVWILVPKGPGAHWYWFHDRTDSPWYPSARLFRQGNAGDWQAPMREVATMLRTLVSK